ncbi:hypothetical protein C0991_004537 [Blastosporella zonata]|nr:hypothetical protein C0991_004537 [Blastosporella zonata]
MAPIRPQYNRFTQQSSASATSLLSNAPRNIAGRESSSAYAVGFPITSHFLTKVQTTQGGFNLGGINATGQIADIPGNWGLIDLQTPKEAYTKADYINGEEWVLVFSDEFNQDGRTFYPGDDPYWEAVDLHYWGTVRAFYEIRIDAGNSCRVCPKCRTIWSGMILLVVRF